MKRIRLYIVSLIILLITGLAIMAHQTETNYEFQGTVQKIIYDEPKHIPTVTVNGKDYQFVYSNRTILDSIRIGDSIVKLKGEKNIQVFK